MDRASLWLMSTGRPMLLSLLCIHYSHLTLLHLNALLEELLTCLLFKWKATAFYASRAEVDQKQILECPVSQMSPGIYLNVCEYFVLFHEELRMLELSKGSKDTYG